jgi:hypothetical protein
MALGSVRPANKADAIYLAPRLRQADRDECLAATGRTPEEELPGSVLSNTYTILDPAGVPIGLFGVHPLLTMPHVGAAWMVATDDLPKYARQFMTETPAWIDRLHEAFPVLVNLVDARNTVHIKWIEWAGFTLLATRAYGPLGLPFIEFAKVK